MGTAVTVLMILIVLGFILKQSFNKPYTVIATASVLAIFTGFSWPLAVEQSGSRISEWLSDTSLMLDVAVVMSVEILLQMSFCITSVNIYAEGKLPKWKILTYKALRWFPGILILPVLFSALVFAVFALPGNDFRVQETCSRKGTAPGTAVHPQRIDRPLRHCGYGERTDSGRGNFGGGLDRLCRHCRHHSLRSRRRIHLLSYPSSYPLTK